MLAWFLVVPLVINVSAQTPQIPKVNVSIKMPDQKTCEAIRNLNTPGPDGAPGPQCWELEVKK